MTEERGTKIVHLIRQKGRADGFQISFLEMVKRGQWVPLACTVLFDYYFTAHSSQLTERANPIKLRSKLQTQSTARRPHLMSVTRSWGTRSAPHQHDTRKRDPIFGLK